MGYWKERHFRFILRQSDKRYPRLVIPVLFSCLISFALLRFGLAYAYRASVPAHTDWLASMLHFTPDLGSFLSYSFFGVFAFPDILYPYNNFLWTMHYELFGSFLVFFILLLENVFKNALFRLLGAFCLVYWFWGGFYLCFLFGMLYAYFQSHGTFLNLRNNPKTARMGLWGFSATLLIAGIVSAYAVLNPSQSRELSVFASVLLLFFVHCSPILTGFFSNRLSRFLGKISFPLYLVHFSVIVSLTSYLIVFAQAHGGLSAGHIWEICAVSVLASLAASVLFYPIEIMTLWLCHRIGRLIPKLPDKTPAKI